MNEEEIKNQNAPFLDDELDETVAQESISPDEELQKKLQRLQADYNNLQKDLEKNKYEMQVRIKVSLIRDLLPVLDNWELAWQHIPDDMKKDSHMVGIGLIRSQLKDILKQYGAEPIEAQPGDALDYLRHEALSIEKTSDPEKVDTIVRCPRLGYSLGSEIIRPAGVIVYSLEN